MSTKQPGPGLWLNITETMLPALEQMAKMAAEEAVALHLEANPPASPQPELLTLQEAADRLKVGRPTLDRLRKDGIIQTVYIGATVRISSTEIDKFHNRK